MSRIEKLNRELERVYLQGMDLDGNIHNVAKKELGRRSLRITCTPLSKPSANGRMMKTSLTSLL